MGKKKDILRYLEQRLHAPRYRHSLAVAECTVALAKEHRHWTDPQQERVTLKQLQWVALLHDCEKERPEKELWAMLQSDPSLDLQNLSTTPFVWHAFAGALTAQRHFGLEDPKLLDAIRYHATGRPAMSQEEMLLFLADAIEPSRSYEGVEKLRCLAHKDLEAALLYSLERINEELCRRGEPRSVYGLEALAYYQKRQKEKG
ncbi:hypothetical protein ABB02_00474 [Clostridiaceae bacterium JG1575]|nr:hypothetical protein ABB02_00474 [Clostridiaceae bacterium JG1575]